MMNRSFYGKLTPLGAKVIIKPSETKGDSTSNMEPTSISRVFAGCELASGCRWSGIYMVWSLEEFADIDLSSKSYMLARKQRQPHKTKAVELPDEGICFLLKSDMIESTSRWKACGRLSVVITGITGTGRSNRTSGTSR